MMTDLLKQQNLAALGLSPQAAKLAELIAAAEEAAWQLEFVDIRSAAKLRTAIAEARKP